MQLSPGRAASRRSALSAVARTQLAVTEAVLPEDKLLFRQSMTGRLILSHTDYETLYSACDSYSKRAAAVFPAGSTVNRQLQSYISDHRPATLLAGELALLPHGNLVAGRGAGLACVALKAWLGLGWLGVVDDSGQRLLPSHLLLGFHDEHRPDLNAGDKETEA